MKKNVILAAIAASTLAVGLAACGSTGSPVAKPVAADSNCAEVSKPVDPHGLIGSDWPWMSACDVLSDVTPAVDQQRAEAIVLDARARVAAAKRQISMMATDGNKLTDPEARDGYRAKIEDVRGGLADALMADSLALKGTPPQGFALAYTEKYDPSKTCSGAMDFDKCIENSKHSASPGLTGGGR